MYDLIMAVFWFSVMIWAINRMMRDLIRKELERDRSRKG